MRLEADAAWDLSGTRPDPLDAFDPRARVLCALAFSAAVSSASSLPSLLWAVPLLIFSLGARPMPRPMLRLNVLALAMALLTALTWPGEALWGPFSREGARMGLLIAVRLNLISVVLLRMIVSMGPLKVDAALARLGLPEKLRALLLLALRGVFLLTDRVSASLLALRLRAPRLGGLMRWKAFACALASSLVRSSDRSERMMTVLRCRGGLAGFAQVPPLQWRRRDTLLCLLFALDAAAILALPRLVGF